MQGHIGGMANFLSKQLRHPAIRKRQPTTLGEAEK
jgi:hypothetical protein